MSKENISKEINLNKNKFRESDKKNIVLLIMLLMMIFALFGITIIKMMSRI